MLGDPQPPRSYRKRKKPGRKTKKTDATVRMVLDSIRIGLPIRFAAARAGISHTTLYNWRNESPEFDLEVQRAEADWAEGAWRRIGKSGKEQWQAEAWRLERRFPEHFALKNRFEHTGKDGSPLRILFPWEMTDDERRAATSTASSTTHAGGESASTPPRSGNGGQEQGSIPRPSLREAMGEDGA